ncbi:hypothetical protein ACWGBV_18495 [Streptomyces sp. NPDC055051]
MALYLSAVLLFLGVFFLAFFLLAATLDLWIDWAEKRSNRD